MVTLLSAGDSDGVRRCDARCHDASDPQCDCICGGRYHGRGRETAEELISADAAAGRFGAELAHLAAALTEEARTTAADRLF